MSRSARAADAAKAAADVAAEAATGMVRVSGASGALRREVVEAGADVAQVGDAPSESSQQHNYMAAMRSAGDYSITCRVRAAATVFANLGHAVYTYYFTHTPLYSENYSELPTLGAFHGAEVPFVFGDAFELKADTERSLSQAMGC